MTLALPIKSELYATYCVALMVQVAYKIKPVRFCCQSLSLEVLPDKSTLPEKLLPCLKSGRIGRRFISDLKEAQRRGYISRTPHFNSIFNYLELPLMTDGLNQLVVEPSLPLRSVETEFAVNSCGFSTGQYVRWFDVKYGNYGRLARLDKAASDVRRANVYCNTTLQ